MGSRRRGVREGIPNINYKREQETFMATMNNVAEAVREAAVAAAMAVERLGVRNGNENEHGEDNGNDENNLRHPERPMTLATFLKVKPPKFKGTLIAIDVDNWFQDEGNIPLDTFNDEFYKKYFLRAARDTKEMELMQLKQGNTTVAEYARNPVDFEEWKCLKFEEGLREDLMSSVVPLEIQNFAKLVNKCKLVEECAKKVTASKASR
ncbi:uncharacterized protein LOC130966403 [Arachis stenosperma]|uniref:uncharacterized protein LOC130966403 n=1 Tax=Arachis stenosperma TaxID=217475 RepID=UPI0025AD1E87|nr:uncharacterized protein LOC130966403 [Arachis stenosperma]